MKELYESNGIIYKKFSNVPFTGNVTGEHQGSVRNGKREGLWQHFYSSGELFLQGKYIDGKREGFWEGFYEDGRVWNNGTGCYKQGSWKYNLNCKK